MPISQEGQDGGAGLVGATDEPRTSPNVSGVATQPSASGGDDAPTHPVKTRPVRSVYDKTPPPGSEVPDAEVAEDEIEELDVAEMEEPSEVKPAAVEPRPPASRPSRPTPAPPPERGRRLTPPPPQASSSSMAASGVGIPPSSFTALTAAEGAAQLSLEERHRLLTALYQKELAALDPQAKTEAALLQHELGELLGSANNEAEAVKAYAKALQLDPAWKPNLQAIRAIFEERKLWPNLLKLLDAEVRFAATDGERAEALVEKGHLLAVELKDPVAARAAFEQAAAVDATCLPAWMALEKMALRDGDLSALDKALAGLIDATAEPSRKVALLLERARLQDSVDGGSLDEAFALLRRAATLEPGWEPKRALGTMQRLAENAGRTAELNEALDRQAQLVEAELAKVTESAARELLVDELVALRRRQAALAHAGGDTAGALTLIEAAAQHAPAQDVRLFLDRSQLLGRAGRFGELADALALQVASWAPSGTPDERLAPLHARWQRSRVQALRAAGRSDEATALEATLGEDRALDVLLQREQAALAAGDATKLVTLYEAEAKLAHDAADRAWTVDALVRAATLAGRQLGRIDDATALLTSALELAPHHLGVVAALDQLYTVAAQPAARAQLLAGELAAIEAGEITAPPERRWRWLETLADLHEIDLDDVLGALTVVRKIVALRPDDARGSLRLVGLLRRQAATNPLAREELASALGNAVGLLKDEAQQALALERAELLVELEHPEAAAALLAILANSPSEPRARAAYAGLLRRRAQAGHRESLDDLAASFRREAEATLEGPRAAEVLLEWADLEEHERGDHAASARVYRDLLDRAPGHPAAVRGLIRTLTKAGDQRGAAEAKEQEIESLTGDAKVAALVALGEDHEAAAAQASGPAQETLLEQAEDAFRRALDASDPIATTSLGAAAVLGRLRASLPRRDAVVQRAAWQALVGLSTPTGPGSEAAAAALRSALLDEAALVEARAGDAPAALALYQTAENEGGGAIAPLVGQTLLLAREGASVELAGALDRWSARTSDTDLRAALLRRSGWMRLTKGKSEGREQALTVLRRARVADPRDALSLIALTEIGGEAADLEARAQLGSGNEVERGAWLVEAAEAAERGGKLKDAARLALAAHALDATDLAPLLLARRVAREAADLGGFARATVKLAELLLEAERAAALFNEAGEAFEHVGQLDEAAVAFRAVLDRTPLDGAAWRRARNLLGDRYEGTGDAGPLLELLDHRLASLHDATDRNEALLDRAALLEKEGDWQGAERDLRALLTAVPDDRVALERLARLRSEDPSPATDEETVELWGRYLAVEEDAERRRTGLVSRARIEERRGHFEAALEGLDEAQELQARSDTAEKRVDLLVKLGRTEDLKEALARSIALANPGTDRARVELRAAQLYEDRLADPRSAAESIARALDQDPLLIDGIARYVNLAESGHVHGLEAQDRLDRALESVRQNLRGDRRQAPLYATMARLWGWRGDDDLRLLALQAEALIAGQAVPPRGGALEPAKELTPAGWERLLAPAAHSVALDIWRIVAPVTVKLFGPDLATVASRRLNAKGIPMAFIPVDKIVRALAGPVGGDYELHQAVRADACLVVGNALVVGQDFADRLSNSARFAVARAATLLKDRLGPLERISDDDLRLFFAACARLAEVPKPRSLGGMPEAAVEERAKPVGKALGRKERAALKALGGRWQELPDPSEFRAAVLDGAARAALVVGGDLSSAFERLQMAPSSDSALTLVEFSVSSDFLSLRRELGLKG